MQLMKNKPLIIGAIVVIILLIAGAIYFFVINDNDSEPDADTQNNGQGEDTTDADVDTGVDTDTDADAGTDIGVDTGIEDNGSAILVEMGFDCQTITIVAEAEETAAAAAAAAAADPSFAAFSQLHVDLIKESGSANNEISKCVHAEKQLSVLVASNTDADLHLTTMVQAICIQATSEGITAEGLDIYLQGFRSSFEEALPPIIDSKVYFADGSEEYLQFKALLEAENIEYTLYELPETPCDA